jgi:succinyl-CoA synthetase beta subunit
MKLLEYEAKKMLRNYGLPTPAGVVWRAGEARPEIKLPAMVKAQVPVGGRGKAGGVRAVVTADEVQAAGDALLGRELLGFTVGSVLLEEQLRPQRELYLAVALDRSKQALVVLAHTDGGVDIEEAQGEMLEVVLDGEPTAAQIAQLGEYLSISGERSDDFAELVMNLYKLSRAEDGVLVEINPLVVDSGGRLSCADAKIELDDEAGFRHKEREFEAEAASAQFVVLADTGTIASLANGAGLAMATNDAIKAAGQEPANFFDVGGGTNTEGMVAGFEKIRALGQVRAIVVNIFAGITRCDEVAQAILAARAKGPTPPLFIRLAGTNAAEGKALLAEAGIELCGSLGECVEQAAAEASRV